MKKILSVLVVLLTLCGVQMRAQEENDKVVIQSATIAAGEAFYLPIDVEWVDGVTYKAFQMDVVFPEGITPAYEENEDEELALVFERGKKLHSTHGLTDNYIDASRVLKLVCVSQSSKNFKTVEGPLVSIKVKVDDNLQGGAYEIRLTDIKFTDEGNTTHMYPDATATFTIPSYHTYKFMDGVSENPLKSGQLTAGEEITAPENKPTRTGYTFKDWNPAFTGTMPDEDVTYVAVWEANKYKMTFVLDDSEIVEDSLTFGEAFEAPKNLTKTGYTFSDVWVPALPETVPAEEMTFIAQWEINQYTMTFVLDEGKDSTVTQDYNTALEAFIPTKTGYEFNGWNPALPETIPAENKTFTAQWERAKFKLTFVIDGQETDSLMLFEDPIEVPSDTVKEGYTFKGWDAEVPETMPAEALTFTAVFEINKYWVTFMAEGQEVSKEQMEYNADIVAPTAPNKEGEGKRFIKWDPEVDAKVPAHDVTYDAIYALIVRDTIVVRDTVVVYDTIRVSTLQRVDAPFINVNADKKIELTCEQKDAVIYYTIDGTEPTEASQLYSEPFEVVDKTVIKAIAVLRSEVSQFQLQVGMKNVRVTGDGGKTYNLQGRQISKASRGVFIQDGKKVIMK